MAWAAARRRLDSLKFGEPAGAPPRTAKKQRAGRRENAAADRTGARKATATSAHMARKATLQLRRAPEHGVSQSFSIGGKAAAKAATTTTARVRTDGEGQAEVGGRPGRVKTVPGTPAPGPRRRRRPPDPGQSREAGSPAHRSGTKTRTPPQHKDRKAHRGDTKAETPTTATHRPKSSQKRHKSGTTHHSGTKAESQRTPASRMSRSSRLSSLISSRSRAATSNCRSAAA